MMDIRERDLHELAKAELEELRDAGASLTWQDVVEINHLAWMTDAPACEMSSARGDPVRVPGAVLWPLTMQAKNWMQAHEEWFSNADESTKLLAYLMAHGRRPRLALRLSASPAVARRAISAWCGRLSCTEDELLAGVWAVLRQSIEVDDEVAAYRGEEDDDAGLPHVQLVAFLVHNTGLSADYWERQVCIPYINEQVQTIIKQAAVDDKPHADDPRIIAQRNLGLAIERIKKRAHNGRKS